jgi:uncharacterized protein (DUF433 family)
MKRDTADRGKNVSFQQEQVMKLRDRIEAKPGVLSGKPVIEGTRISVELVLDFLASGATVEELLKDYPHITREDILACVAYAADTLRSERVYPVSTS